MKNKKALKKYAFMIVQTLGLRTVVRASLDIQLKKQFKRLKPGIVLDVGSKYLPYKKYIPHKRYMTLDIDRENNPDICCDLHRIKWKSNYFDTVIATNVIEHLYNPQKAINEIYRVLKKNGACILTAPFVYPYHAGPKDYYRFTKDSLKYLLRRFRKVEIYHHGNKLQILWHILTSGEKIGLVLHLLNPLNPLIARIHFKSTSWPSGYVAYAKK